jgi:hypothetical protein
MWGLSTIGLVFVPFFLSIIMHHLVHIRDIKSFKLKTLWTQLRTIGQRSDGQWFSARAIGNTLINIPSWLKKSLTTVPEMKSLEKLPECLLHLPFLQPFNHLRFFIELNNAILKLDEAKKDLREAEKPNDTMSNEERTKAEKNIAKLEKKDKEAKKSVAQVQGKFQQTKILMAYGESAPQFCLQLAIMIQIAHISPLQIASVNISIISFTLAASNVYSQMPTKYSEIPHQDWKNNLYIVPAMFFSVFPRLTSLSLLMAYLRHWTFLTIGLALVVEFALLKKYLQDDQGTSLMGMFTSLFSPCIVKDHYTKFFLKTSLSTTATYIVAICLLFALVEMELIIPSIQSFPPTIHCYKVTEWIPTANQTRCYYNGTITQDCLSTLVSTGNEFPGFVPVCQAGEEVWHRLGWVCLVLFIFLLISLASGYFLHWYLDPINRLKATSWWCLGQVWDPEQEDIQYAVYILAVIGHFSEFKTFNADFMKKHWGKITLLYHAVCQGHIQFVDVLAKKCNAYMLDIAENRYNLSGHNLTPLVAAVKGDRPKVLKLVIDIIKGERT